MCCSPHVPSMMRGVIFALLFLVAAGVLVGPAGLRPETKSAEAVLLSEIKKLPSSQTDPFDRFGFSVAVSGDIAVVGAPWESSGAAYVYERNAGGADNWGEVKKLTASDGGNFFGFSVAVSGDTILVGAWGYGVGGAAYIFQRDQGGTDNWGEVKKLTASDAEAGDRFGLSVALSGDTTLVGAHFNGAGGAAYIFQRDQGGTDNWGEVKKLLASDAQASDNFGWSVAVSGDTAIVGAFGEGAVGSVTGAAYVYKRNEGGVDNWGEVKKLLASDPTHGAKFGYSVALSGDTAVVGAESYTPGSSAPNVGAAYVYQRDRNGAENWGVVRKLGPSSLSPQGRFGVSVAVAGDTAIVGVHGADVQALNTGGAHVFLRDHGGLENWGETDTLRASDASAEDAFGIGVAASGNIAVVGANGAAGFDTNAGAAYVFQLKLSEPGDTDGDGCSDQREHGLDATQGGLRDYKNPNDYYDVYGPGQSLTHDGVIDLPNDILGVIQHFAPLGTEPTYDVRFDRGPSSGPNPWNMTAPDGVIDLPNDILGVILQFFHNCV